MTPGSQPGRRLRTGTGSPTAEVSVLMPVRDAAPYLEEALASMTAQTFEDFELVVVDDGSTDATPEILADWARRERRLRPLRQEPLGIVAALERARAEARGAYLARMDADDVARPERLATQMALLGSRTELSACGCGVRYFPESAVRDGARRYERWINHLVEPERIAEAAFVECPVAHPTLVARRSAVDAVGGWVDRGWPEDYDLVLRLLAAGHRIGKAPEVLHGWRERPDRLSRTDTRYAPEAFRACKIHYLRAGPLGGGRGAVVWGAGPLGKAFARALRRAGSSVTAFVELDPGKIGQVIHEAPVVDPLEGVRIRGPLHLAAVGQEGARDRIVQTLREGGLRPLEDYVAVA